MKKKFWNWDQTSEETPEERTLYIDGVIAEESWFDDDVTPRLFKDELMSGEGPVALWINSPGGDCIAAAQIYNMIKEYPGNVTVKIDGMAASAASVIAMAGDEVLMSPVSTMMIHNPSTVAVGDHNDLEKAIEMLNEVKESIINAYVLKSGLSRAKLSKLMENTSFMNANEAVKLGLADGILYSDGKNHGTNAENNVLFSQTAQNNALMNKIMAKYEKKPETAAEQAKIEEPDNRVDTHDIRTRLDAYTKLTKEA